MSPSVPARRARISAIVPIGRPIANLAVFVLDPGLRPVPIGVPGELFLAGVGLARGYWDRPALTAERFVPDGASGSLGARLYRTGDRTRLRPDGEVEFLGRLDFQIKLRGFRIELGEIESALAELPGVREAAVLLRIDLPGGPALVAFLVPEREPLTLTLSPQAGRGDQSASLPAPSPRDSGERAGVRGSLSPDALRSALRERLPEHMVPAYFAVLDALPLSPSGKADRKALATIEVGAAGGDAEAAPYRAPSTPVEEVLAGLWAEVLRRERVGADDDFLALGGHSLLAVQVVSRVRRAFDVELPLAALFQQPTVAGLARAVEGLRGRERGGEPPALLPVPRTGELPLSFAQQRLWFLEQLVPGNPYYHMPGAVRLQGELDVARLAASFTGIAARHESLRTRFPAVAGRPVQAIDPPRAVRLPVIDLSALSGAGGPALDTALEICRRDIVRPFDLAAGPLLRLALLRLGEDDHAAVFTVHHIVSDGWSVGVLARELVAFYGALDRGEEPLLAPLPVQYADYAAWQRRWLDGETLAAHLAYWRERLAGVPPSLELPTDRPRQAAATYRGASRAVLLGEAETAALERLCRQRGATLFMALLAGLAAHLERVTGKTDLVVGTDVANRDRQELEGLIGFFVNELALRVSLTGDPSFEELLAQVRATALGAYAHQELPFEKLVEEIQPDRDLTRTPLVQVSLTLNNVAPPSLALPGIEIGRLPLDSGAVDFEHAWTVQPVEQPGSGARDLAVVLQYSTDLFDATTAERALTHFARLLAAAVAEPAAPLSRLSMLSAAERHQLVTAVNDTDAVFPSTATLHELFAREAERVPDAIALTDGPRQLSYRQLDAEANRVAHWLVRRGVGQDTFVALLFERQAEMIVAILASLKAGGAYAPIEPGTPVVRLAQLLEEMGAPALLTQRSLLPEIEAAGGFAGGVLLLDRDAEEIALEPATAPGAPGHPLQMAYVNFTSGSTGRPKGVVIPHDAVVRLVRDTDYMRFDDHDAYLQISTYAWDAATFEIWGALLNGGRLVTIARGDVLDFQRLAAVLQAEQIRAIYLTAALFNQVVDHEPAALAGLKVLISGGETASVPHFRRAAESLRATRLINEYGPTENTAFSSWQRVDPVVAAQAAIPIGKPLANSTCFVLDRHLRPVAVGVTGELYLGGVGLARGYLGRPAKTAETFLPHPFLAGARVYRTGDLARWRTDGGLDFLGRADLQIKLRGFRIELGEVEAVIAALPGIREVAVLAPEDRRKNRRLVAYVATEPGLDLAELKVELRRRLPEFMVPSVFVELPALPLSATGKVDRKALPAPDEAPGEAASYEPPATETERRIAEAWAEVLGRERIGRLDDFFLLGGHSLLATQVVARLRETLSAELPLRALFEEPTVAGLAERIDALTIEALTIEALTIEAGAAEAGRATPDHALVALPRSPAGGDRFPLSFAQRRLWFLDQLQPGSAAYNIPAAVRLSGPLDAAALGSALARVVARHEALRTTFEEVEGEPVQVVAAAQPVPLPVVDLAPLAEREAELAQLARAEAALPFDLARGPLVRARLLRLGPGDHALLLSVHHIASDGWSMGLLVSELAAAYGALARGLPPALAPLPLQYADFAAWQRRALSEEALAGQREAALRRLAGAPLALDLPADRPRPAVATWRGASVPFALSPELSAAVAALARQAGATPFMVLAAALEALLARWSGQADLLLGTPVAGRERREVEGLIGLFVNTLVLRGRVDAEAGFTALLAGVREDALQAFGGAALPFETLVEALEPARDMSRSPLFQVMLSFESTPAATGTAAGDLALAPLADAGGSEKFDLALWMTEGDGGLRGNLSYATDLFDAATARRLLAHFEALLSAVASAPAAPLASLALLSPAERQQAVAEWNGTAESYGGSELLHGMLAEQIARTPDAVAVVAGGAALSYAELDRRAQALASRLRDLGAGPDVAVGIAIERSLELSVGLLAILQAGAAYVPFDPSYPPERLAGMAEDLSSGDGAGEARDLLVLTAEGQALDWAPVSVRPVVVSDAGDAEAVREIFSTVTPGHLAYVIYTSGSTGRPKGVMNSHRGIANRLRWMQYAYDLRPGDRVLQKTPASFDVSVWELFWPLATGATLVMARPEGHKDPAYLRQVMAEERITTTHFVPSMLQAFLDDPGLEEQAGDLALRQVMASGEALPRDLVRRFHERLSRVTGLSGEERRPPEGSSSTAAREPRRAPRSRAVALHNLYGPTEAAVDVTFRPCPPGEDLATVPIGRPIANLAVFVLDPGLRPVPIGVPGELFLAGVGLARGYWDRPALTAERFVPDGASGALGARLYRTGDRTRLRPDGEVEFLGRLDFQIKLRGFRIELGEIESALAELPGVREAAVLLRTDLPGGPALVAFLVPEREPLTLTLSPEALRSALRERLPEHMVPAYFAVLDALPLSPSGKADRKALAKIEVQAHAEAGEAQAPRTPIEELLAGVYAELLGGGAVGRQTGFFERGGHSLLATRLVSRLRTDLGIELPVRVVFEAPTVAGLGVRVEEALRGSSGDGPGTDATALPPLVPRAHHGEVPLSLAPLSFAQERLWFLDQLEPGGTAYNIPTAVRLTGALDRRALAAALSAVAERHEALRTTFAVRDGQPVQVIAPPARVPLPVVDLSLLGAPAAEAAARRLAASDARRPFDLARGPVLRVALLTLGEDDHALLANQHHIAGDGWSTGILIRELAAFYGGAALPPLAVQYADYAAWQRSWLGGERLEAQLGYWRRQLAGPPPVLELATDRPRPPHPSYRGGELHFALPADLSAAVEAMGRRHGATVFMVLLAGFQALLARWSGQRDLAVGTPIAGRNRSEVEGLIGCFLNTLVLRARLGGDPSWSALLAQARQASLAAYAHADVPFEKLVGELEPERDLARAPLFQAMLIVQNTPAEAVALPGLEVQPLATESGGEKFDLTLAVTQAGGALTGVLSYATDLFDRSTMARLVRQLGGLLAHAVVDEQAPLSALVLLDTPERHQLLAEWNDSGLDVAGAQAGESVWLHRFEEQVAVRPDATALAAWNEDGDETWLSYAGLAGRASSLADELAARGVGPDVPVGLCLPRNADLLVALLAIHQAGGAYLPLDPSHPAERRASILADAGAPLLVTSSALLEELVAAGLDGDRTQALCLDAPDSTPAQVLRSAQDDMISSRHPERSEGPGRVGLSAVDGANLAYAIYTSGSTGKPKGVQVPHAALANFLASLRRSLGFSESDRLLAVTTLAFDIAGLELLLPLTVGARITLASREELADGRRLAARIAGTAATALQATPATWQLLLASGWQGEEGLAILCGGEALPRPLAHELGSRGQALWNLYGPTETTIWSSLERIEAGTGVTAGRPIANTEIYAVDRAFHPVPPGVPGEVWIAGDGVARGYLGQPALSAERFVPDAWSGQPGARAYRTGDLGRLLPDGRLEVLGRLDFQVKLRGFRIELGEIEAALVALHGVRQATVVLREDLPGGRGLAAYVVEDGEPLPLALSPQAGRGDQSESTEVGSGPAPSPRGSGERAGGRGAAALREALRQRLPDYMVPAAVVVLDALPLSASGKVDRKALAALPAPRPEAATSTHGAAPLSPTAELLLGIFREALGTEALGPQDDFFALGGHSLLAMQVLARARQALGVDVPVRKLFEAPTAAALARVADEMLRAGSGLLEPPLLAHPDGGERVLSFAQERLWFLNQLAPEDTAYNLALAVHLEGELDARALGAALDEVRRRHEVLRSTYANRGGRPVLGISPPRRHALPVIDLGALPPGAADAQLTALARREPRRLFDLARGPLLRTALLRRNAGSHAVLATMHHIVSDGWSLEVFTGEVTALYAAFAAGRPSPLAELPVQFADFAAWQRRWLQGEALEAQLAYWRAELAGAPDATEVPTDRPRPAVRSYRGGRRTAWMAEAEATAAQQLARGEGATLFMLLAAAWNGLLSRSSGQGDVLVGTPIANRSRPETEPLIGFLVNTVVLRTRVADDPSFRRLLARAREATLGAFAHQDVPFEKLVDELATERSTTRAPFFQVLFMLEPAAAGREIELPRLAVRPVEAVAPSVNFDLILIAALRDGRLLLRLDYDADLYDATTADRLLARYTTLLAAAVAGPDRGLSALPSLSPAEAQQVEVEWNDGALAAWTETAWTAPEQRLLPIHRQILAQARRQPEAVALVGEGFALTFGELNRRAARVARRLRKLGVGPETVVGLLAERTPEALVAILGILKAGGAYLPLDPGSPAERLALVLERAGAAWVLAEETIEVELPAGVERLALDPELSAFAGETAREPAAVGGPENPLYLIFTSGSTGVPKGVATPHRAFAAFAAAFSATTRLTAADRLLLFAPLTFDASALQVFPVLAAGGSLVLERGVTRLGSHEIQDLAERHALSVLDLPAALWRRWVDDLAAAGRTLPRRLRLFLTGGESLPLEKLRRWAALAHPEAEFLSSYGPTETTVTATAFVTRAADVVAQSAEVVPIGRPLPGVAIHLLDRRGRPVGMGLPGELAIGGAGVARGYQGEPARTAEAFVPSAFDGAAGARLYATGDLARLRPDGVLEFLGRADLQVKIRGFRIELGEVEAAVKSCPGVAEAVVLAREDVPGDKRLAAYVVAAEGAALAPAEVLEHAAGRLPAYMVPAAVVVLAALPNTASGKVDRRALLALGAPERGAGPARSGFVPPSTPAEKLLAGLWREVLAVEQVGAEDDFFALGGHSLLATQLVSRLREALSVELPLRTLFEAPTLAALAREIEAGGGLALAPAGAPLVRVPRDRPLPLSFAQLRLWFFDQLSPGSAAWNLPAAVRLEGPLDRGALAASLTEIVSRHESLRTRFAPADGEPVQVVEPPPARFPLPAVDLSALGSVEAGVALARSLAAAEGARPFDLAQGPPLRAALAVLAPGDHVLLFTMHHITSDLWSMEVLMRELAALYGAFAEGRPSPLAELPIQYADYAAWQRRTLEGEALSVELAFWKERLAGAPSTLALPADRPRPALQTYRGASETLWMPRALGDRLGEISTAHRATLFMTLTAGFTALLQRWSGQSDVLVGTPVAGRDRIELEGLIGFFLNALVVRADLAGDPTFDELVERVRGATLEAFAHPNLPFERLVDELGVERSLDHSPIFQVMLTLREAAAGGGMRPERSLPGLTVSNLGLDRQSEQLDLTLTLEEGESGLSAEVSYAADLFDRTTIRRLLHHLASLLAAAAEAPDRRLSALPLLAAAERHQLLVEASDSALPTAPELSVHERFRAWVRRRPEAVVAIEGEDHVSYAELDRRASRMGWALAARGVGPESLVALLADRGLGFLTSLFAVFETGGAYLPLDPRHPAARHAQVLARAGAVLALAAAPYEAVLEAALAALPEEERPPLARLEELLETDGPAGSHPRRHGPENLAYVIFTSGSTGVPKGAMVEHRGMLNHLDAKIRDLGLTAADSVAQTASQCFDISVWQFLVALGDGRHACTSWATRSPTTRRRSSPRWTARP